MEGLFRQIGIYNPEGQKYTPVDKDQVMYYREDKAGQILQEGINEAGGMVTDFDGRAVDITSPLFIATNGEIHDALRALIQSVR